MRAVWSRAEPRGPEDPVIMVVSSRNRFANGTGA
jgi:hypothetical protein